MKRKDISYVIILALFAFVGTLSWRVYFKSYRQSDSINIHHFPKVIGNWTSEELLITDEEKAILETDNVFVRRYTNDKDEEVFLFIVYSQNNRKVSHPPEICYTGGGATILSRENDIISASVVDNLQIEVKRLKIERKQIEQIFAYWFKVGDSFTSNYWKQQALIAYKSILGQPASSALIRISSTIKDKNDENTIRLIKEFGQLVIPHLDQHLP